MTEKAAEAIIDLAELRERLDDPDLTLVDVRALPAYNGWRARGAVRGGHIPGAVAFPSAWLKTVDSPEVERLLRSKGILNSREVVLYGDRPEDSLPLRTRLAALGQLGVRTYRGGWAEWAAQRSLPVDRLTNYQKLVHPDWLRELLDGGTPEAGPAGPFRLFHVNFGVPQAYVVNHIPAALYLDTNRLENPEDWNRPTAPQLDAVPRSLAINHAPTLPPEPISDIDEATQSLSDREHAALVSVRTWREHIGQVSGYNYIGPAGRIAGDVWGNCGSDAYHMEHYRNVDNTMRSYPEIAANWTGAGITTDKWVAFYCGTGWRASETWFYAYLMGWPRIAVYDGGWFEWSQDPISNPIEVGEPVAV